VKRVKLAISILSADFSDLKRSISLVKDAADLLHLDIMDGNFVPHITFGPLVVEAVRSVTDLPLEAHLMISHPAEYIEDFAEAGADRISFHAEVTMHLGEVLGLIHRYDRQAGVAISPQTPAARLFGYLDMIDFVQVMAVMPGFYGQDIMLEALDKVMEIKQEADDQGRDIEVEVDGGINDKSLDKVLLAGADMVVVGSPVFAAEDPFKAAMDFRKRLEGSGIAS
jgi:ribulose-phosphate 3-epimerase